MSQSLVLHPCSQQLWSFCMQPIFGLSLMAFKYWNLHWQTVCIQLMFDGMNTQVFLISMVLFKHFSKSAQKCFKNVICSCCSYCASSCLSAHGGYCCKVQVLLHPDRKISVKVKVEERLLFADQNCQGTRFLKSFKNNYLSPIQAEFCTTLEMSLISSLQKTNPYRLNTLSLTIWEVR